MSDKLNLNLPALMQRLREFGDERDWNQFHTPKNISMALTVEASELLELFQWLTPEQSIERCKDEEFAARVGEEVSDILFYLLRFADTAGLDLVKATERKLQMNAQKYPVALAKGNADKR